MSCVRIRPGVGARNYEGKRGKGDGPVIALVGCMNTNTMTQRVLGWMATVGPVRSSDVGDHFRATMGAHARYAIDALEKSGDVRRFKTEGGATMFVAASWVAANAGWM